MKPSEIPDQSPDLNFAAFVVSAPEVAKTIEEYGKSLKAVVDAHHGRGEFPKSFYVPDLWHITKGRDKDLTKSDANVVWNACVLGANLGKLHYKGAEIPAMYVLVGQEKKPEDCPPIRAGSPGTIYTRE